MTTTKFTMTAAHVKRLLAPVAPFMSGDETFPILNAVHVTIVGSVAIARATDRYALAEQKAHIENPTTPAAPPFRLPAHVVKPMLAMLKPTKAHNPEVEFTVNDAGVSTLVEWWHDDETHYRFQAVPAGDYPNIERLLDDKFGKDPRPVTFGVDPKRLLQFRAAITNNKPGYMKLTATAANKPLTVEIGEDFRGLLMPIHLPEGN